MILAAFAVPHPPLIIPEVGSGRERGIQATIDAFDEVGRRVAQLAPDTIVVSSPHATAYRDYIHISPGTSASGSFAPYGAHGAKYEVAYDDQLATAISAACAVERIAAGTDYEREPELDHGTMIAAHFIQKHWPTEMPAPRYVRMGISGLSPTDHYRLGMAVQRAASVLSRRVVYMASGDLSHKLLAEGPYGFAPEGPEFDRRITRDFAEGGFTDILAMDPAWCDRAAECGWRSFIMMAGALDRTAVRSELLSYEGPFGVGYGVAAFTPTGTEGADPGRDVLADLEGRMASADATTRGDGRGEPGTMERDAGATTRGGEPGTMQRGAGATTRGGEPGTMERGAGATTRGGEPGTMQRSEDADEPDTTERGMGTDKPSGTQRTDSDGPLGADDDPLVRLARVVLETRVRSGRSIHADAREVTTAFPNGLPNELLRTRAACFVSLKKDGDLRGCIGTIVPTQPSLAEEICSNAVSAGTRDPRFPAVRVDELDKLVYSVDVLTEPEPIASTDELDPRRYGVIVSTRDGRRGLLLPDLDGVDTVAYQVTIAAQKGHIDLNFDDIQLERFEVVRHR